MLSFIFQNEIETISFVDKLECDTVKCNNHLTVSLVPIYWLLFDDNKVKMAMKPGKILHFTRVLCSKFDLN